MALMGHGTNRIENYYHHDEEQLGCYKKHISRHRA